MAFENLTSKLQETFKKLKGKGKLNEKDVKEAMREVKLALLEADVNYRVVKEFVNKVTSRSVGSEVMESLTPGQQVIKIVNEELVALMGDSSEEIKYSKTPPTKIMLVGLQGAGKTTMAGKLGQYMKKQGKKPLLAACDVYRPAAIKQLQVVAEKLDLPSFSMGDKKSPVDIAKASMNFAENNKNDVVIIDTAGRLHIDEHLMDELINIKKEINPDEILLVVDAMTGQDAVNVAESFNEKLNITGVILTKLDGDTRGGAALSVRYITGKPIKFAGIGEKLTDIEVFHPDRMASRILGMGDVLSLIEKAEAAMDLQQAKEIEKKLRREDFTLDDFLDQLHQVKKLGPLDQILGMIPGMGNLKKLPGAEFDEGEFKRIEAIIYSMTRKERRDPAIINGSRRKRIAFGSGTRVQDVNRLLKQFSEAKKMIKRLQNMQKGGKKRLGAFKMPFGK